MLLRANHAHSEVGHSDWRPTGLPHDLHGLLAPPGHRLQHSREASTHFTQALLLDPRKVRRAIEAGFVA